MTITTKDRARVGQTTYKAFGSVFDHEIGDNIDTPGCSGEYKTLNAVKLVSRRWIAKGAKQIFVARGTYEAQNIVRHADWVQDERWACNGFADSKGGIDWEEESW